MISVTSIFEDVKSTNTCWCFCWI